MRERNRGLDGLRGYAAVAVIFYHCLGERFLKTPKLLSASSLHDVVERLAVALFNGSTAVTVFFVMSGAVLMNSLQHQQGNISRLAIRFVTDRFFRIYPALFVSVLICAIVFYVTGQPRSLQAVLENLALYSFEVNGATWTLNAEAFATLLIFASFLVAKRGGLPVLCLYSVGLLSRYEAPAPKRYPWPLPAIRIFVCARHSHSHGAWKSGYRSNAGGGRVARTVRHVLRKPPFARQQRHNDDDNRDLQRSCRCDAVLRTCSR